MAHGENGRSPVYDAVGPERVAEALARRPDDRDGAIARLVAAYRDAYVDGVSFAAER
jgi:hypothetical protein